MGLGTCDWVNAGTMRQALIVAVGHGPAMLKVVAQAPRAASQQCACFP